MVSESQAEDPVLINGRQYRAVKEGLAQILAPYRENRGLSNDNNNNRPPQKKNAHNNDEGDQAVFYNPIQQYNRDLSVLAILTFGEGAVIEKKEKNDRRMAQRHQGKASKASKASKSSINGKKRKVGEIDDVEVDFDAKRPRVVEDKENENVAESNGQPLEDSLQNAPHTTDSTSGKKEKVTRFTILDALSASGLRAIRYAREIPLATNIIANDLSPEAVKSIELNIDHNNVRDKVHSNVGDARAYMYSKVGSENQHSTDAYVHRFDVIDLDPYGTAAPFLDAAVQALADGGLLCVTCTDAGVFASNGYPEKAFALYGGVTMKGLHSHEAGLRLILHAVASSAAKYGFAIEPLLSLSIDFYARLFIRIHKRPQDVKLLAGTTMIVYNCDNGCGAWTTQLLARNQTKTNKAGDEYFKHGYSQAPNTMPFCEHCNSKMHLGGPMWAGLLHNPYFIQRILDKLPTLDTTVYGTTERIRGMLTLALEEDLTLAASKVEAASEQGQSQALSSVIPQIIPRLPMHMLDTTPFFFIPSTISKVLHTTTPGEDHLRGAIKSLGYKVTRSHCKPGSIKTNAPWDVLWEIMREWVRQKSPVKEGKVSKGMAGWKIMQRTRDTEAKRVYDCIQEIGKTISKGVEGEDELRRLFESGLYRLQHGILSESPKEHTPDSIQVRSSDQGDAASGPAHDLSKLKIVFDSKLGRERPREGLVRYQTNPRENWGPMSRAG